MKHLHDPKAFIEYSQYMDDGCNNINDDNPSGNRKHFQYFNLTIKIHNNKFLLIIQQILIIKIL